MKEKKKPDFIEIMVVVSIVVLLLFLFVITFVK